MQEIKNLLEVRLKALLKTKTKGYEQENLLANLAKTYTNSIVMIDDYMKEEQTKANLKEKANCIRQDTLIVKINASSTLSELNEIVEKADEIRKEHNCNCTLFIKII